MATKIRHFLNTATKVVSHAVSTGRVKAEPNIVKIRQSICSNCEYLLNNKCQKCGCFVSAKTALEAATCPEKRW